MDTPDPQSQPVYSPDICPSPDAPPQNMDKSHLSDSTSTTINLNETFSLDTSCEVWILPAFHLKLQHTSSVESVEIELFPDFE